MKTPTLEDLDVMARTLWGEARGEGLAGMRAVAHVIMNRVTDARWPNSIAAVCKQPYQFSCWNVADGTAAGAQSQANELRKVTFRDLFIAMVYPMAVQVAAEFNSVDPTGRANHYLRTDLLWSGQAPTWANPQHITAVIGNHTFLNIPA